MRYQLRSEPVEERFNVERPKNQTGSELVGGGLLPLLTRLKQTVSHMPQLGVDSEVSLLFDVSLPDRWSIHSFGVLGILRLPYRTHKCV